MGVFSRELLTGASQGISSFQRGSACTALAASGKPAALTFPQAGGVLATWPLRPPGRLRYAGTTVLTVVYPSGEARAIARSLQHPILECATSQPRISGFARISGLWGQAVATAKAQLFSARACRLGRDGLAHDPPNSQGAAMLNQQSSRLITRL